MYPRESQQAAARSQNVGVPPCGFGAEKQFVVQVVNVMVVFGFESFVA